MPDRSARGHPTHSIRAPYPGETAGLDKCLANFVAINVSVANPIFLLELGQFWVGATGPTAQYLARTSTRGTPGANITPDLDNSWGGDALKTNVLLDLGPYSVQPTIVTPELTGWTGGASAGSIGNGFVWTFPEGIRLVPGSSQGIGIFTRDASNAPPAMEMYAVWEERSS